MEPIYKTSYTDVYLGNTLDVLKTLPDNSVHMVVTSPPYFNLRSYLKDDDQNKKFEIGINQSIKEYIKSLLDVFKEVKRVLHPSGVVFVNLGDSYSAGNDDLPAKNLIGVPWKFAFAMQEDGWILRQDIIWYKPNPMPESITDRCTKSHEYVFLFSKSQKYFYDNNSVREPFQDQKGIERFKNGCGIGNRNENQGWNGGDVKLDEHRDYHPLGRNRHSVWKINSEAMALAHFATMPTKLVEICVKAGTSHKGCCSKCKTPWYQEEIVVGTQVTEQMKNCGCDEDGKYYGNATKEFDEKYVQNASDVKKKILLGMSKKREYIWKSGCDCNAEIIPCIVLDIFGGSGTSALVANKLGRKAILIELNKDYIELIKARLNFPRTLW